MRWAQIFGLLRDLVAIERLRLLFLEGVNGGSCLFDTHVDPELLLVEHESLNVVLALDEFGRAVLRRLHARQVLL